MTRAALGTIRHKARDGGWLRCAAGQVLEQHLAAPLVAGVHR